MIKRKPEKMHSIKNDRPDWDGIPDEELNRWQRIAKKTNGWVTGANALTISCGVLFMNGLVDFANGQHAVGTAKIGVARLGDLGDGYLANKQGVKNSKGKRLDAAVDMAELAVGLPVLYVTDTVPLVPLAFVAIPKVIGTIGSVAAEVRGRENNVTSDGKLGTAALWLGIGSFLVAKAVGSDYESIQNTFEAVGGIGMIGGGILSTRASVDYFEAGFGPENSPPQK